MIVYNEIFCALAMLSGTILQRAKAMRNISALTLNAADPWMKKAEYSAKEASPHPAGAQNAPPYSQAKKPSMNNATVKTAMKAMRDLERILSSRSWKIRR
jgi:hypothetical protein